MKTIKIAGALIAIYVLAALLGVFDIDDSAIRDVQRHGYSDVVIISRHYMFISLRGCGKFDTVRYDMAAVNALGQKVSIRACGGWFRDGMSIEAD